MDLAAAKEFLSKTKRYELRDHAFGDTEVHWMVDGIVVGRGYFSGAIHNTVSIGEGAQVLGQFSGTDAGQLRECGELALAERNDEVGPDEYVEGSLMPGLTKQAVYNELTKEG